MQTEVLTGTERAKEVLRRSRIRELRNLTVEPLAEGIALHGYASSFYHKQLAQELVRNELNGEEVLNYIEVVHPLP
jgi:hypothetical protein